MVSVPTASKSQTSCQDGHVIHVPGHVIHAFQFHCCSLIPLLMKSSLLPCARTEIFVQWAVRERLTWLMQRFCVFWFFFFFLIWIHLALFYSYINVVIGPVRLKELENYGIAQWEVLVFLRSWEKRKKFLLRWPFIVCLCCYNQLTWKQFSKCKQWAVSFGIERIDIICGVG